MAASKSTVERVLEVILKHVPKQTALKILEELMTVPGNKSFRDTIERMYNGDRDNPLGGHPWRPSRPRRSEIRRTARRRTRGHGGGTRIRDLARKQACRSTRRCRERAAPKGLASTSVPWRS